MPGPGQAVTDKGWNLGMDDGCQANITGLRQAHRAYTFDHGLSSDIFSYNTKKDASRDDWHPYCETEPKLLSMLLQVTLYGMEFVRGGRAKPSVLVDIDEARVLNMQNHLRSMIAIHIKETQRGRD